MRLNQAIHKYFTSEWLHAMMANDIDYVTEAFNQFKKHKKLNILKQINDIHLTQRYIFASDGSVHGGGHNATEIISLLFIKNGKITHEIIRKEKSILLHGSTPILAACDINMTFTSDKKRIDGYKKLILKELEQFPKDFKVYINEKPKRKRKKSFIRKNKKI
jgi:hypothetical protein